MSTYDDRLASLERKVAALELRRLYDESLAQDNTPAEQGHSLKEINENMAILLGVMGKQGQSIKELKEQSAFFGQDVNRHFADLNQEIYSRFESIDKRFDAQDKRFDVQDKKFEIQERKLDQILSLLTTKSDQETE